MYFSMGYERKRDLEKIKEIIIKRLFIIILIISKDRISFTSKVF